ncbi:MAG: hypothetical protein ACR2PZ_03870 [Pseudomonadales bacterium]
MAKYMLLVQSNPSPGQEYNYNQWYTQTHLPEVLEVEGFSAAQRFKVRGAPVAGSPAHQYVALYELETEDPEAALVALSAAVERGTVHMSDALDQADVTATLIEPITERVTSKP